MAYQVSEADLNITDAAFEEIKNYNPTGADDFTLGLLSVLLLAVSREYEQLRNGYEKYTGLAGWACRNLLELDIFTKWVLQSPANAKRFVADLAIDGTELFESMRAWLLHYDPGAETKELDETIRLGHERRKVEGTTGKKHLEVRDLADAVGMTADYKRTMKLCSKLVHPTAWSVISMREEEGEYAAFRVILFQSGSRFGLDAYNTIREHLFKDKTMTPRIKNCVERARHYQHQILQEISKHQTADNSDRSLVSTAYIKMVVGDYGAILTLVEAENPGAAFKLFRLLYEDVINALWVQAFAPPGIIKKLLKGKKGQVPGTMAERAAKLDTIFVPPATVVPEESLFVDLQSKFWKAACSYTHGGSLAINRELAGYDELSTYQMLRSSTTLFVLLMDAMYKLHHGTKNDVLWGIAQTYFAEKW